MPKGVGRARATTASRSLPHYDQDLDGDRTPESVVAFREAVAAADALVVATPEYNGSMTGVLKNAIDWASRPRGSAALDGKPAAVVSVSPSPRGAQWAREDLVKILRVAGAAPSSRPWASPPCTTSSRTAWSPTATYAVALESLGRLPRRGRASAGRLTVHAADCLFTEVATCVKRQFAFVYWETARRSVLVGLRRRPP